MITSYQLDKATKADREDCCLGNTLFIIAGIIGIAKYNNYSFGFKEWINQEYFINSLPELSEKIFEQTVVSQNYKGFDIGFRGFKFKDNTSIYGQFGSWKYFSHCENLIRYYFTMKDLCEPIKDSIIISYRYYWENVNNIFSVLDHNYYHKALKKFPDKKVYVITNNPQKAKEVIKEDFVYLHTSPIIDFYLLTKADYLIMSNSTFSWWGAWLSKAKTVAPLNWYSGDWKDCPVKDLYCDNWIVI